MIKSRGRVNARSSVAQAEQQEVTSYMTRQVDYARGQLGPLRVRPAEPEQINAWFRRNDIRIGTDDIPPGSSFVAPDGNRYYVLYLP